LQPKFKIQVENSAPSQAQVAKSVVWASKVLASVGVANVADLGCDRLRNLIVFESYFPHITLVDTQFQCGRISKLVPKKKAVRLLSTKEFEENRSTYDAIFLISVLHVIDRPRMRKRLILLAYEKLTSSGYLVTDVPAGEAYYRKRCTSKNRYGDGWVMGNGSMRTFYKNYSASEFDRLVTTNTGFTFYDKISLDHHIIRIWQKRRKPLSGLATVVGSPISRQDQEARRSCENFRAATAPCRVAH
jgi:hypothetical protein